MDKVTGAIEAVFAQRPAPHQPYKATLRDLFDLDSRNGGWNKPSDRGAVLERLDAKTLSKLRDRLEEEEEKATNYCGWHRYQDLRSTVGVMAMVSSLPTGTLFAPKEDTPLPSEAVIHTSRGYVVNLKLLNSAIPFDHVAYYTRRGSGRNLKTPVLAAALAEALKRQPRHITEREIEDTIEEALGVSRSKQQRWRKRMEEVGMTWRRFTADQVEYVALGDKRGRRSKEH